MKYKTVTGIPRASVFSPNHIGNDAAIFNGVAQYLREKGYEVLIRSEQDFITLDENPQRVFTMMRNQEAIRRLQEWEQSGCRSVNSALGIEQCGREPMTRLLLDNGIPYPDSIIVGTRADMADVVNTLRQRGYRSFWLKRGDFHAIHREDVTYVRCPEEAPEMLAEYALRGIEKVVINEHLEGDLIKLYGIAGTSFFYHFYPFDSNHSKFGLEQINGKARGIPFDREELREICRRACEALQIIVYGGDCIVSPDGTVRIIDFNDWPSFAPCRHEAIPAIGEAIINKITT
jgi:hypothetical protein